jgi:hypothetical protein
VRRRQLMIAGLAGTAAPAVAAQFRHAAVGELGAVEGEGGLVVSGRILARNGKPLAGASVEVWRANARGDAASATTDGDGRFFATIASSRNGRPQDLRYRVSRAGRALTTQRLHFARGAASRRTVSRICSATKPAPGAQHSAFHSPEAARIRASSAALPIYRLVERGGTSRAEVLRLQ